MVLSARSGSGTSPPEAGLSSESSSGGTSCASDRPGVGVRRRRSIRMTVNDLDHADIQDDELTQLSRRRNKVHHNPPPGPLVPLFH
jgi:hypothetical protein